MREPKCPRCKGMLVAASKTECYVENPQMIAYTKLLRRLYADKVKCLQCGRVWEVSREGLDLWPNRIECDTQKVISKVPISKAAFKKHYEKEQNAKEIPFNRLRKKQYGAIMTMLYGEDHDTTDN